MNIKVVPSKVSEIPASAEIFMEVDETHQFMQLCLSQSQFCVAPRGSWQHRLYTATRIAVLHLAPPAPTPPGASGIHGFLAVDISEAWRAKQKEDYFFGSMDANRVHFSTGRDVALSPKQDGPALNYFVYPYVEVDGKPYDKLDKQFSFEEIKSSK